MTTITLTINWYSLFFGFLIGMFAMAIVMFTIILKIDKECKCGAWESEALKEVGKE